MREEMIEKKYEEMGISKEVYLFGKKIEICSAVWTAFFGRVILVKTCGELPAR